MLALLQPPNLTRFACLLAVDFTGRAAALQALPPASRQAGGRQNPVDLDRPSVRCMRVRVVCVWTCRCWELLWGFGVRTRQQVKIEANLCLSGPDIYSNTLVFLRKKIRKNKLTTRTSNTTSYEHLWETYEVGRSSVMIKINTDTLLSRSIYICVLPCTVESTAQCSWLSPENTKSMIQTLVGVFHCKELN